MTRLLGSSLTRALMRSPTLSRDRGGGASWPSPTRASHRARLSRDLSDRLAMATPSHQRDRRAATASKCRRWRRDTAPRCKKRCAAARCSKSRRAARRAQPGPRRRSPLRRRPGGADGGGRRRRSAPTRCGRGVRAAVAVHRRGHRRRGDRLGRSRSTGAQPPGGGHRVDFTGGKAEQRR